MPLGLDESWTGCASVRRCLPDPLIGVHDSGSSANSETSSGAADVTRLQTPHSSDTKMTTETADEQSFRAWLTARGATVSPAVGLQQFAGMGRGAVALEDIQVSGWSLAGDLGVRSFPAGKVLLRGESRGRGRWRWSCSEFCGSSRADRISHAHSTRRHLQPSHTPPDSGRPPKSIHSLEWFPSHHSRDQA